ncbi:coiled-coil domain-containing protein 38 [Manduca sexta]|uniref:coiled-coil domain-containing protein 38 n=1 Tax=Manduca sexta TaxID=7130 RepID=UPI00188F8AF6|nr:coiled-coil domain-containing protein 38 [Manduca sexta]
MNKAVSRKIQTPKSLLIRRVRNSKLLKIPSDAQQYIKEYDTPYTELNIKKRSFPIRDRKLTEEDPRNPFDLPKHLRLFVFTDRKRKCKPEPFIMTEPHTICDIDNTFYKAIEGRPLRPPGDVKMYMKNIRDITLYRANAAYLMDQLIQIETDLVDEGVECKKVSELFAKCKNNFVQFAKESYEVAKIIQMMAEERGQFLAKVADKLESYCFEYVKVRNQVSATAAVFEILAKYRRFLNSLSPGSWREKYDRDSFEEKVSLVAPTDDETASPEESIDFYKQSLTKIEQIEPVLYFKHPEELMLVYEELGEQCLNYMQVEVMASPLLNAVIKNKDDLKSEVMAEIAEVVEIVESYKYEVTFVEEKEKVYEEAFFSLLMNEFKELCSSEDTIKLFTYIQYANKQLFGGTEDPKDDITSIMLQLELHYLELTLGLDSLDQTIVKQAVNEFFAEDIKIMKRAHNAQRSMRECDILKKALYTSFEPPRSKRK